MAVFSPYWAQRSSSCLRNTSSSTNGAKITTVNRINGFPPLTMASTPFCAVPPDSSPDKKVPTRFPMNITGKHISNSAQNFPPPSLVWDCSTTGILRRINKNRGTPTRYCGIKEAAHKNQAFSNTFTPMANNTPPIATATSCSTTMTIA